MPGPYGASLFGPDENWEYDLDEENDEEAPDIWYGWDDWVRDQDLTRELEEALNEMLRNFRNDDASR